MQYNVYRTTEFDDWLGDETLKSQVQVEKRISKIEMEGHFGTIKDLEDDVWELKWKNGRRVYYAYLAGTNILLLLGGNKNGQSYAIVRAQKILKKYTEKRG
jgi:putative addiction module killer protein